jgi:hypothetical protein
VRALRPGVWHWKAPHPDWRQSEPWDQNVSSYAIDDGERLLLFDPIAPPSEIEKLAAERDTAVVLTAPWHERDTQQLVERLGVPVYTPLPDTAEYLMQTYGLAAEQAGDGSPDVVWLLKEGIGEAHPYGAGDRLDVGVEAFPGPDYVRCSRCPSNTCSRRTAGRVTAPRWSARCPRPSRAVSAWNVAR